MNLPASPPGLPMGPAILETFPSISRNAQISTSTGLRQHISREDWEEIKPLIHRLYIVEERTFAYIAASLAVSHKFRPTKRQFTTKIKEWDFKKNMKRDERGEILQSVGPIEGDIKIDLSGRKHKKQKLLRWENERRKETGGSPSKSPPEGSRGMQDNSNSVPIESTPVTFQQLSSGMNVNPEPPPAGLRRERRIWVKVDDEEYQHLPHAEWMDADVLNSPTFSRLLKGLSIETRDLLDDIEDFNLPAPSIEQPSTNVVESIEPSELTLHKNDEANSTADLIGDETNFSDPPAFQDSPNENLTERRLIRTTTPKPFKFPDIDALFPSGIQVKREPSPFNELYPFPSPGAPEGLRSSSTLAKLRQKNASALFSKLMLLKRAGVDENHPGVLGVTNRLADVFYDSGNMVRANSLYRKVLSSQKGDCVTWPEKALHAQIGLIDGLCRAGYPLEAKGILESVYSAMTKRFDPFHLVFRRLLKAKIEIFNWLEDWDAEDPVTRDLTQICLVQLGPKDPETINAVYRLASVMMGQGSYQECERLHRMAIQLCGEGTEKHHERMCWSSLGLGRVLEFQSRLDEAIKVMQAACKRNNETLGEEHEASMICNRHLGRMLGSKGLFQESEELLATTITLQTKVLGEAHIHPLCTMFELGGLLLQRKHYEESAAWLEKCFHRSFTLSNFEFTTKFCKRLGSCYEEQGRYREALRYYQEAMGFFRGQKEINGVDGEEEKYMVKIQEMINGVLRHTDDESPSTMEAGT